MLACDALHYSASGVTGKYAALQETSTRCLIRFLHHFSAIFLDSSRLASYPVSNHFETPISRSYWLACSPLGKIRRQTPNTPIARRIQRYFAPRNYYFSKDWKRGSFASSQNFNIEPHHEPPTLTLMIETPSVPVDKLWGHEISIPAVSSPWA